MPSTTARVKSKTSTVAKTKAKAVAPSRAHHSSHAAAAHPAAGGSTSSKAPAKTLTTAKTTATPTVHKVEPAKTTTAPTAHKLNPAKSSASVLASPSGQRHVEAQLAHGNSVALVLFWDPKGTEDVAVHHAVQAVAKRPGVGIDEAPASAVASFGTITRGIQVYETPTLLVINKKGQTTVLTGVLDAYSIEQAINEARQS